MSLLSDINVEKIMDDIKSKISKTSHDETITEENVLKIAEYRTKERIQMILNQDSAQSEKLKYLQSLNLEFNVASSQTINDLINDDLHQANISVDIQTQTKIDTSKPKIIRPLVLKIRHILQNEIRSTLNPVINNQIRYNSHTISALNSIAEFVQENSKILESLKKQFNILEAFAKENPKILESLNKHLKALESIKADLGPFEDLRLQVIGLNISRLYNHYLHREPTRTEINHWTNYVNLYKIDWNDISSLITSSNEYENVLEEKKFQELILYKKLNERQNYYKELEIQKKKDKKNSLYFVDFEKIVESILNPFAERHTEYLWVLKNLPTEGNLLDVGSSESELANELTKIKSLRVFGVDIRSPDKEILYEFSKEDATHLSFNDEFFDLVTIVSSIEHFGLDVYGGQKNDIADKIAIKEIKRVMKPKGLLLMTIPFGKVQKPWSRVYDIKSLHELLDGFKILEEKYFIQDNFGWSETTKEIAELNEGPKSRKEEISSGAIACIMAIKS